MKRPALACLTLAALLWLAQPASSRAEAEDCPVPPELTQVSATLPHVAERLRRKEPIEIVAIGGGSTRGTAAGSPELAYPHRLQQALAAFYPDVTIKVTNKGEPRQSTRQMLDRFQSDVLPEHPALVVWETGITDAVRAIEVDDFAAALQAGIDLVKTRAIDILLVDMQFSRRASEVINFDRYLDTIHREGELNEVFVFPRFAMMRYWSEQHVFNFDEVAESERAGFAAKVYRCIGRRLAEAIRSAAR